MATQQALEEEQAAHEAALADMQGGMETERQSHAETLSGLRIRTAAEQHAQGMVFTSDSAREAFLSGARDALTVDEDGTVQGMAQYAEGFLAADPNAVLREGEAVPRIVSGGGGQAQSLSRAEVQRMPYEERLRLKKRAPALYRELTR